MKNKFIRSVGLLATITLSSLTFGQQQKLQPVQNLVNPFQTKKNTVVNKVIRPTSPMNVTGTVQTKPNLEMVKGSFSVNVEKQKRNKVAVSKDYNSWFNLNEQHTFKQISEKTDELGIMHTNYQQYYKGIRVEGAVVMMNSKQGIVTTVIGKINSFTSADIQINITNEKAKEIAKAYLHVTNVITDYPVDTVITKIPKDSTFESRLALKVRIDSYAPFIMCNVYIDANTGTIINRISLIADADVSGTAQTLYKGTQSITCDSYSSSYRLKDNARKIETYDATTTKPTDLTTTGFNGSSGFTGSADVSSSSTTFSTVPSLTSFTISAVSQSWWYNSLTDVLPDLYIIVKDGSSQSVYKSNYKSDTNPTITFDSLNILLTNPPYTVELWDYDPIGNDFGGSYSISTSVGTKSWAGNGNNGTYVISMLANPATDVHWGMEKTYDFYLNVFNRNSFDGKGSVIKNFINPPTLQNQWKASPNNAYAQPAPYNFMCYGMGDNKFLGPVVGLDVEGHEYSHMVVGNSIFENGNPVGLSYQGESGALNESFADIFGTCVEFYANINPNWTIGEGVVLESPYFLRSMSNPILGHQPNTYNNGSFWRNTLNVSEETDWGGVHTNSGVQNYWFYLLCQGGTGTNGLGNAYSVTGIGMAQAQKIVYKNLTNYLVSQYSQYIDAYNGSLLAAENLYGNPSTQYSAVRQAWYAVGIGNDPNNSCSGTTNLTSSSGTITDGSGSANYSNNSNCKWVIAPPGATQISLTFAKFDTEIKFDSVIVYDGPNETFPVLATWWGNTLPPTINTSAGVGAMCIRFKTDNTTTATGWSANYSSTVITPSCSGETDLTAPIGSFSNVSGTNNYGNNQFCYWYIAPPCATTVTLSFSQFKTEQNYDGVIIYDDYAGTNRLAAYSGTSIPSTVTSTTGKMLVIFVSDYATTMQGFSANYTSTGSSYCSGVTTINTNDNGTITDGSGTNNYCDNMDCQWLIQPPQAASVTLNFTAFDLEPASSDGKTIFDAVEVYDGTSTSAPLLGRFAGSNTPPAVTSTTGSMFIRFHSDLFENRQGWSANYTSTQNTFCTGTTILTTQTGTFSDGSGTSQYANNSNCSWVIQPTNAKSITLSFSDFNTELNNDGVIIYDGATNTSPVLGKFSGSSIPSSVTSTGGSMYIEFLSNPSVRGNGWTANYTSKSLTSIPDVIITQVYGGGGNSGATFKSDFIELFNTTNSDINITGWCLYYLAATSSATTTKYEFSTNTIIKAGKHFALKCADGTGTQPAWNVVFDGTSTLALGGTAGKIIMLKSNATFTLTASPTIEEIVNNVNFADYVPYGTTAIPIWGSAMTANTASTTAAKRKFVNGQYQYTKNIGTDFEIVTAEPRNSSITVGVKIVNDNNISLFAFNKTLFVNGINYNEDIDIYNTIGLTVYSSKVISNSIPLNNLSSGIYIVRAGGKTYKIKL